MMIPISANSSDWGINKGISKLSCLKAVPFSSPHRNSATIMHHGRYSDEPCFNQSKDTLKEKDAERNPNSCMICKFTLQMGLTQAQITEMQTCRGIFLDNFAE